MNTTLQTGDAERPAPFRSLAELRKACLELPTGDSAAAAAVMARQAELTKPPGSLGRLEELVAWLARWGRNPPRVENVDVLVFAGNHGVTVHGVSPFPAAVTAQMVANFANGGAAINQLANAVSAKLRVIPLDLDKPTADFTVEPAMDEPSFIAAVTTGYRAVRPEADLVCLGEMGIGNTTAAAAAPLAKLRADGLDHAQAAHVSAEAGHRMLLDELKLKPLLDLGMRLGEGSGAALAVSLLRSALACHDGMATFAEAGVANKPH